MGENRSMSPDVQAALIAGGVAFLGVTINTVVVLRSDRKRRETEADLERGRRDAELLVTALDYFKESQRRSVGIAALEVLRRRSNQAWTESQEAVRELFYRQLLYLFAHGRNRWQAHEISNMEGMTERLLKAGSPLEHPMSEQRLLSAMTRYTEDWNELVREKKVPDEADGDAVDPLRLPIGQWQAQVETTNEGTD